MDGLENVTHNQPYVFFFFFFRRCKKHSRLGHASAAWNTAQRTLNCAATQRCAHGIERDVRSIITSFIASDKRLEYVSYPA